MAFAVKKGTLQTGTGTDAVAVYGGAGPPNWWLNKPVTQHYADTWTKYGN